MIECEARLRAWGNSIGIVIPKEELEKEKLSVNSKAKVFITAAKTLKVGDIRGKLRNWKKPTPQIMKEIKRELDSKFF